MFIRKDVEKLYSDFSEAVGKAGVLDRATKELIAIACSIMADCLPCIEYHYTMAVDAGATKEMIAEANAVAMSVCAGSKKAKYSGLIEQLEKK